MAKKTAEAEKKGEVYLRDGRKAWCLGRVGDQYAVRPMWEGEEDWEEWPSPEAPTRLVGEVLDEPPVADYHDQVRILREEIERLCADLAEVEGDIMVAKQERHQLLDKLKQVPALRRIDDFIEGKFTHFVSMEYRYEIRGRDVALESNDRFASAADKTKLLSLFGRSGGDLNWGINSYSDGSGASGTVIPCQSEEEAIGIMQEDLSRLPPHRPDTINWKLRLSHRVHAAEKYGLRIAQWAIDYVKETEVAAAKKELREAEKTYKDAARSLALVLGDETSPA